MKRVVLDSDDENEAIDSLPADGEISRQETAHGLKSQIFPRAAEQGKPRGTSSSDNLRLDLNQAYSAMIELTPVGRLASDSPSISRLKRRRSIDSTGIETSNNVQDHQTRKSKLLRRHSSRDRDDRDETGRRSGNDESTAGGVGYCHKAIEECLPAKAHESSSANVELSGVAAACQTVDETDTRGLGNSTNGPTADGDPKSKDAERPSVTTIQEHDVIVIVPKGSCQRVSVDGAERKKRSVSTGYQPDDLSNDELCALPKECYKPRPSRSRSDGLLAESTSTRAGSGGKSKKRKSTRTVSTDESTLANGARLKEMGFQSSQVDRALVEAGGSLELAVESLPSNPPPRREIDEDDELNTPKRKKCRKQPKHETLDDEPDDGSKNTDPKTCPSNTQNVHVLILSANNAGPKDEKLDIKSIKRGRGRPKKIQAKSAAAEAPPEHGNHAEENQPMALQEADVNEVTIHRHDKCTTPSKQDAREDDGKFVENTQSPSKAHSPLNKGKVPFKLGLSRRARIEPLLRFIKK